MNPLGFIERAAQRGVIRLAMYAVGALALWSVLP